MYSKINPEPYDPEDHITQQLESAVLDMFPPDEMDARRGNYSKQMV